MRPQVCARQGFDTYTLLKGCQMTRGVILHFLHDDRIDLGFLPRGSGVFAVVAYSRRESDF